MFLRKYSHNIYKVQVVLFLVFIFLTIVYYNYPQAHRFFNRIWCENSCFCFDYLFSFIMTMLFACFFWIVLVYPFILLFSIFFMKMGWKKIIVLLILYLTSFVCEFSLYTIPIQQMFKERRKQNPDEIHKGNGGYIGKGCTRTSFYKRDGKALASHLGWIGYFRPKNYLKKL